MFCSALTAICSRQLCGFQSTCPLRADIAAQIKLTHTHLQMIMSGEVNGLVWKWYRMLYVNRTELNCAKALSVWYNNMVCELNTSVDMSWVKCVSSPCSSHVLKSPQTKTFLFNNCWIELIRKKKKKPKHVLWGLLQLFPGFQKPCTFRLNSFQSVVKWQHQSASKATTCNMSLNKQQGCSVFS